jgi:hypothetical protein
MPLPNPRKGQDQNAFMSKCMGDETIKKEFPNQKQRIAVCLSQFKRKKATASEDTDWDSIFDEDFILF